MKFDRLMSGLLLGLMFAAGPAFAQSNIQPLNTDGITKAMGKEGGSQERCTESPSRGQI